MKKLKHTPTPGPDTSFLLEQYINHTLILHEKDWEKIRKLTRILTKKAARDN